MTKIEQKDWTAPKGHPQAGETFKMVSVEFDDGRQPSEIMLTYSFNAMCDIERETELNLGIQMNNLSAQQTRAMVCAYLRTAHAVTLEEAGDVLTRDRNAILVAMSDAMRVAHLVEEAKPNDQDPDASADLQSALAEAQKELADVRAILAANLAASTPTESPAAAQAA